MDHIAKGDSANTAGRNFFGTFNNYFLRDDATRDKYTTLRAQEDDTEFRLFENELIENTPCMPDIPADVRAIVYAVERGANGTVHLQFCFRTNKPMRPSAARKLFKGAHIEKTHDYEAAVKYIRKEAGSKYDDGTTVREAISLKRNDAGVFEPASFEEAVKTGAGKRTDLDAVKSIIDAGGSNLDVADVHFGVFLQYSNALEKYRMLKFAAATKKKTDFRVIVLYGDAGSGKSHMAYELDPTAYRAPDNGTWFDGLSNQKTMIMDDFNGNCKFTDLVKILDVYPHMVQVKGGHASFNNVQTVIITSNVHPFRWYTEHFVKVPEHVEALQRRMTRVLHFTKGGIEDVTACDWPKFDAETVEVPKGVPWTATIEEMRGSMFPAEYHAAKKARIQIDEDDE